VNKLPPPPPLPNNGGAGAIPPAPSTTKSSVSFEIKSGAVFGPQRVLLYGQGGIGKTVLASLAPRPLFIDLEGGTKTLNVSRVDGITDFSSLRAFLAAGVPDQFDTVVLDSGTKAEAWATEYMIKTRPLSQGVFAQGIEDYGYGKGYRHLFDIFCLMVMDLDNVVAAGKNVIVIAHDCAATVPNPAGEDFLRYEPHLQAPASGKNSIRNHLIQWADHVLYLGLDVFAKDGKATGGGSRTIYTTGTADHIAKHRQMQVEIPASIPFTSPADGRIWKYILPEVGNATA